MIAQFYLPVEKRREKKSGKRFDLVLGAVFFTSREEKLSFDPKVRAPKVSVVAVSGLSDGSVTRLHRSQRAFSGLSFSSVSAIWSAIWVNEREKENWRSKFSVLSSLICHDLPRSERFTKDQGFTAAFRE